MWIFYYVCESNRKGHGPSLSFAASQTRSPNIYIGLKSHLMPRRRAERRSAVSTNPAGRASSASSRQRRLSYRLSNTGPTRRSARLADSSTHRVSGSTFLNTAMSASHIQLGGAMPSRSTEAAYARHVARQRSRRTRLDNDVGHYVTRRSGDEHRQPTRGASEGSVSENSYALQIVSGPPSQADAGRRFGNGLALPGSGVTSELRAGRGWILLWEGSLQWQRWWMPLTADQVQVTGWTTWRDSNLSIQSNHYRCQSRMIATGANPQLWDISHSQSSLSAVQGVTRSE